MGLNEITMDQIRAEQAAFRATPFVSEEVEREHQRYAHLLPGVFPSGQNKPHVCGPGIGDGCCRCEFEPFKRGGARASVGSFAPQWYLNVVHSLCWRGA